MLRRLRVCCSGWNLRAASQSMWRGDRLPRDAFSVCSVFAWASSALYFCSLSITFPSSLRIFVSTTSVGLLTTCWLKVYLSFAQTFSPPVLPGVVHALDIYVVCLRWCVCVSEQQVFFCFCFFVYVAEASCSIWSQHVCSCYRRATLDVGRRQFLMSLVAPLCCSQPPQSAPTNR